MAVYNPKSLKAEEFINDEEILATLKYAEENKRNEKLIDEILSIITLIIYLVVSFITMAWHITWIIWVVYSLISEVIKLFFVLRGKEYENEE